MNLKQMQGLEWLIRDINDDLRIVFEHNGNLITASFLLKRGSSFITNETDNDFEYVSSKKEISQLAKTARELLTPIYDSYSKPKSVTPRVFKYFLEAVNQTKLDDAFQITPTNVYLFNSQTNLPFFVFDESVEFNPVSVISVAKQDGIEQFSN